MQHKQNQREKNSDEGDKPSRDVPPPGNAHAEKHPLAEDADLTGETQGTPPPVPDWEGTGERPDVKAEGGTEANEETGKYAEEDVETLKKELSKREETIKNKNEEIESLKDILKRRQADFENYKKRILKSYEETKKLAIKDFALEIIDINDDLLRALEASSVLRVDPTQSSFIDGIQMTSRRIEGALQKYGIVEIDSLHREFDPAFNEAVEIDKSEKVARDTITKVYQKGFRLDDYVLRSAKVRVTKPDKADTEGESGEDSSAGEPAKEEIPDKGGSIDREV